MPRPQVKEIPLSAQLQPAAQPVDTYEQPGPSPLRGLAESLATADRGLRQFLDTRDRKKEEEDLLRGKAAYYNDSEGEFATMVSDGTIPAQYSPFYVKGFKNAQGAVAGDKLRQDYQQWWDSWEGKDSEDPQAFQKGFHEFLKARIGTEDPDVLAGLLPHVEALQQNATTQYTQYRHDRTVDGNLTTHGALITSGVQDGLDAGLLEPKGADYGAIIAGVNVKVAEALKAGDPGGKGADLFVDTMSAKILETRDPNLLKWFDSKVPGKDYTWAETPHGLEVKNATLNSLETIANKQQAELDERQRAEQKRLKDEAEAGIVAGLLANPQGPLDEKLLKQAEKNGNPTIRVEATNWRETLAKGVPSDPAAVQGFYSMIITGEKSPEAAMRDAMSQGVFTNAEDLTKAQSFVQSFKGQQDTIEKAQGSATFKDILETIRARTIAKDPTTFNPISGWSNEGFEASSDFRELVARWIVNNPNATPQEIEAQVQQFGKQVTDRIQLPAGGDAMMDAQQYDRNPDLEFQNAWQNKQDANVGGPADADVAEWEKANQVGPEEKQIFQQQANRMGMSYEEYIRSKAMKKREEQPTAPDGTPLNKISYDPSDQDLGEGDIARPVTEQQASQWIDAVFTQHANGSVDPQAQTESLLTLIREADGAGNYNAVFGRGDSQYDLGQFSLDEILAFQQDARRRGYPSTAIGGYQFLYKTLRGLKAEMGLSGSEKFTPQLQDKLASTLLNRRGLQAYGAGRISKKQFALSLSKEWAALPNPNTGRSFYAADGLNKSRVHTQHVYNALGFQPVAYAPGGGYGGNLTFNHPDQEAGIQPALRDAVSSVGAEMGRDFTVLSGYRSKNHPVERSKRSGGGEHTHGNAMDLDMTGLDDGERSDLVQRLMAKGVKRFITYSNSPNMLHIDLKDQTGDGLPYFMHDKSAKNLKRAPAWLRALAQGTTI